MGKRRKLQKMENSGNEAKKYLKTKEVTILTAAFFTRFARILNANWSEKVREASFSCAANRNPRARRDAATVTSSRLGKLGNRIGAGQMPGRVVRTSRPPGRGHPFAALWTGPAATACVARRPHRGGRDTRATIAGIDFLTLIGHSRRSA